MNSLTKSSQWSPISYQLQFNFKFRKCLPPLLFIRARNLYTGDHRHWFPIKCIAQDGEKRGSDSEPKRHIPGNSWADTPLRDWFGDSDQSACSLQNISAGGPKLEMKPLNEQQEALLTIGEEEVQGEEHNKNDGTYNTEDESTSASSSLVDSQYSNTLSKTEENVDAIGMTNSDTAAELLGGNQQQGTSTSSRIDTIDVTVESSSSADFPMPLDSGALEKVNVKSVTTSETQNDIPVGVDILKDELSSVTTSIVQSSANKKDGRIDITDDRSVLESQFPWNAFTSSGIPAPLLLSTSLEVPTQNVLASTVPDEIQAQTLAALQVLKIIESDAEPGELCTRRHYARWLVSASNALSRSSISKVYPAMCIENVTELAFDNITAEDPDFASIQGLAEAGLISSKLSRHDLLSSHEEDIGSFHFYPDSPLSRQDLVTWKMALDKRQLPEADRNIIRQLSGFIDIDKINPDAWPALVADLSAGEQGVVAQAFGYTRLFQPEKPVTKGQAAIAVATGEATDIVSEELARIEAESMAEKAVAAHNALVSEVEKEINESFEKELMMEWEKTNDAQKMVDKTKQEVERLRWEREEHNIALMKERAAIESEMEVLNELRLELDEQLQSAMSNKVEASYEKERVEKLCKETENENLVVSRLQYELEIELKALSIARAWAEDEAKRVQDHAKAL